MAYLHLPTHLHALRFKHIAWRQRGGRLTAEDVARDADRMLWGGCCGSVCASRENEHPRRRMDGQAHDRKKMEHSEQVCTTFAPDFGPPGAAPQIDLR